MATSLTMAARRAAAFTRFPSSTTAALVQRRGLAGAAGNVLLYSTFSKFFDRFIRILLKDTFVLMLIC